jgi:hypothetical protein
MKYFNWKNQEIYQGFTLIPIEFHQYKDGEIYRPSKPILFKGMLTLCAQKGKYNIIVLEGKYSDLKKQIRKYWSEK